MRTSSWGRIGAMLWRRGDRTRPGPALRHKPARHTVSRFNAKVVISVLHFSPSSPLYCQWVNGASANYWILPAVMWIDWNQVKLWFQFHTWSFIHWTRTFHSRKENNLDKNYIGAHTKTSVFDTVDDRTTFVVCRVHTFSKSVNTNLKPEIFYQQDLLFAPTAICQLTKWLLHHRVSTFV